MLRLLCFFIQSIRIIRMALESRELLTDDVKIYSNGLITALKQDKLIEARGYLSNLRNSLDPLSEYIESQISLAETDYPEDADPVEIARVNGDNAVAAAKRAEAKAERLEGLAREAEEETKRLKKASRKAKKEAAKASKAAKKAEKAERKIQSEARSVAEHADKANQAARHS